MQDILGYAGKRVVVTGAASGMGEATARMASELGADVIGCDIKPVAAPVTQWVEIDLMSEASIDRAVAAIEGEIDVLLNGHVDHPFKRGNRRLLNQFTNVVLTRAKATKLAIQTKIGCVNEAYRLERHRRLPTPFRE